MQWHALAGFKHAILYAVIFMAVLFGGVFSAASISFASKAELLTAAPGGEGVGDSDKYGSSGIVEVQLGKARVLKLPNGVSDVLVANTALVDVDLLKSNSLYVVGLAPGDTNILTLDSEGNTLSEIDLHVTYDLKAINALLRRFFPDEAVEVGTIHDQIYLSGTVSSPETATRIAEIVSQYVSDLMDEAGTIDELIANMLQVRGEQQVMLRVKVLEASRNFIRELGVQTNFNDPVETSATTIFGNFPPSSTRGAGEALTLGAGSGVALGNDPAGTLRALFDSGITGIGTVGVFLNALEDADLLTILAEPNLTSISGQQAGFLAGGEFPVPVGRDQVGNLVIEYREFGVSLNFLPLVLSEDRINLRLNTEVSSLDFNNSVSAGDILVPGLDVRRAETTVEIPSGGSLMIAGLLQSDALQGMAGLPGVNKTPIIGDLISSKSFERNETELVVIVTAYLVRPYGEKEEVEVVPPKVNDALAQAFISNMRKSFNVVDSDLFLVNERFGYIVE